VGEYRISAGTVSPVLNSTISPGTISALGTENVCPPRETVPVGELSECSDSIVFSAAYSWKKPTTIFKTITAQITPPSIHDWMPKLTAMAKIKT
jgi:hypothetical protein